MRERRGPALALADVVPLFVAAWFTFVVGRAMAARVAHPFDLEWMEGGMLVHVLRMTRGQPIYTVPDADWIPYIYPPGYSGLVAAVSDLVGGVDYAPARTLSVLGTLLACGALVRLGAMRGSLSAGLLGAVAFLLTWRASGAFFDMARPDGLAMASLAWTFLLAIERRKGALEAAGLMLAAAFVLKHHSAAFGVPLALGLWIRDGWRPALRFGLCALLPALLFLGLMQWRTEGRFWLYLVRVPASHPMDYARIFPGVAVELGIWLLPAVVASSGWLLATLRSPRVHRGLLVLPPLLVGALVGWGAVAFGEVPGIGRSVPWQTAVCAFAIGTAGATALVHLALGPRRIQPAFWFAWLAGAVALVVVGVMRGHNGGFMNVLMPAHWLGCAGLVVAVCAWRTRRPGPLAEVGGAALLSAQLAWGWVTLDLPPILPTPDDVRSGRAVVEALRGCPEGPIFSPYAPWMVAQAGREPGTHLISLWDISHEKGPFFAGTDRVKGAAREHHWACVLTNANGRLGYAVELSYLGSELVQTPPRALTGKTGWRVRPTRILLPEENEAPTLRSPLTPRHEGPPLEAP